jgi:hypothetical protein
MSSLRQSSVVADLESQLRTSDLFEWIETEAEKLGRLGRNGIHGVQFTDELRSAFKISSIRTGEINSRAVLASDGVSFQITFNSKFSPGARRFAIAHEFGHALFTDPANGTLPRLGTVLGQGDRAVESICDYFAGAMLVPRNELLAFLQRADAAYDHRPPLHLIDQVARIFHVQRRIAGWRLLLVTRLNRWVMLRAQLGNDHGPLFDMPDDVRSWKSVWCVCGDVIRKKESVKGYEIPFSTHRRIPAEMIPERAGYLTEHRELDSRWWDGTRIQPAADARRPMRSRLNHDSRRGFVAKVHGSIYVAFSEES